MWFVSFPHSTRSTSHSFLDPLLSVLRNFSHFFSCSSYSFSLPYVCLLWFTPSLHSCFHSTCHSFLDPLLSVVRYFSLFFHLRLFAVVYSLTPLLLPLHSSLLLSTSVSRPFSPFFSLLLYNVLPSPFHFPTSACYRLLPHSTPAPIHSTCHSFRYSVCQSSVFSLTPPLSRFFLHPFFVSFILLFMYSLPVCLFVCLFVFFLFAIFFFIYLFFFTPALSVPYLSLKSFCSLPVSFSPFTSTFYPSSVLSLPHSSPLLPPPPSHFQIRCLIHCFLSFFYFTLFLLCPLSFFFFFFFLHSFSLLFVVHILPHSWFAYLLPSFLPSFLSPLLPWSLMDSCY
ncbi:uncharacterized protein LOC127003476 [Eriocheir sinensis]|uniref:uncharacterized protein LOC127003476 n=1 Tax=Eriocheir sinensis TaxID=95602 RepID=UPI0021C86282|nr:uncharacterized protein LOC127003476 [Eriocheir sinensis]